MPKKPNTKEPNAEGSLDTRSKPQKDAAPADVLAADVARGKAVDLRIAGKSFRKIADELGVSVETAYRYVQDGWTRLNEGTDAARERLRDMQEARLDAALEVVMPLLTTENLITVALDREGNDVRLDAAELRLKAVDRLVKVINVQNVLRGLNAPLKIEASGKSSLEPLDVLAERLARLDAEEREKRRADGGQTVGA